MIRAEAVASRLLKSTSIFIDINIRYRLASSSTAYAIFHPAFAEQAMVHINPTGVTEDVCGVGSPTTAAGADSVSPRSKERTPSLSDIDGAISTQRSGLVHLARFEHTGNVLDLKKAISNQEGALVLIPEGHTLLPPLLSNIGSMYLRLFQHTGDHSHINNAISIHQRVLKIAERMPDGHADLHGFKGNLGASFMTRFKLTNELALEDAVNLAPLDHPHLPNHLTNLGISLTSRSKRDPNVADIDKSIFFQQKAVDLTPNGHGSLPDRLGNLSNSLGRRYELKPHDPEDIARAISAQKEALLLTGDETAKLPGMLNNVALMFQSRFRQTGDRSNIDEAIKAQRKALDLIPEGHADVPQFTCNLGKSLHLRFTAFGDTTDLDESISLYKSAATCKFGPPQRRLDAAVVWARFSTQSNPQSPTILDAYNTALGLLALMGGLERTVRGRHTQLQILSSLASEAAASASRLDRADKALEWLEQGRCVVWSQLNNLRIPFDDLRVYNNNLAQSIANISKQLEHAGLSHAVSRTGMSLSENISAEDEYRSRLQLARRWDDLLRAVRNIPRFEHFLKSAPCSALMQHLPSSGPVVIINVGKGRCDAFALLAGADEPLHIPLPNFSLDNANRYRIALNTQLQSGGLRVREGDPSTVSDSETSWRPGKTVRLGKRSENVIRGVLRALWIEVVKPILDMLAFSKVDFSSGASPPRIWWCPTGPLSFLPIHAAGIYGRSNSENVLDYAISSYTPTVTAITDRVKNDEGHSVSKNASGLFLTNQPNPPGAGSISGTTKEVQSIFDMVTRAGVRALKIEGSALDVGECLKYMQEFSSIHLACHTSQNAAEPLHSRFLFHAGSLDLATIMKSDLKHADLAFLSACQTSTGEAKLSNEAVHLAAGMLAAGYRRVVATMWSISDKRAQEVANDFYEYLGSHRDGGMDSTFDGTLSAYALHYAIQNLRHRLDDSEHSLLTWAPFVHFGY
ncbi:CHAT domain-containing protein [Ephemerocybe angulata]|uniref:CHAT domain-containing protein n=1 Tax=Ephemerocybe angulata TaxID=980116 RepID=A0A8H6HP55_9AGAR|nr:CHAT domain-containing protein [Tulosesus angulatus]